MKPSSRVLILLFIGGVFTIVFYGGELARVLTKHEPMPQKTSQPTPGKEKISEEEKQRIEEWIKKNNLNEYGDPKDRVYLGGTPLFNEATGETIDRYDYVLSNHPDRPWNK